jgi:hypothetical protein
MSAVTAASPATQQRADVQPLKRTSPQRLGAFSDSHGRGREVLSCAGAGKSRLVIDRLLDEPADQRLVAHLSPDEPAENAQVVARLYIGDRRGRHCRRLEPGDLTATPAETCEPGPSECPDVALLDAQDREYRLACVAANLSIGELRWQRRSPNGERQIVTMRGAVGALESYEPVRALTTQAILASRLDQTVSTTVLQAELQRMALSPVVLNRGLREAVLAALANDRLTLSEIAIRCGRCKRDARGRESGETSWLARRIGTLAEHGCGSPTPWIYTDVLALIARRGLGVAPREVELG